LIFRFCLRGGRKSFEEYIYVEYKVGIG
jgi:hypothetical protein